VAVTKAGREIRGGRTRTRSAGAVLVTRIEKGARLRAELGATWV